MAIYVPPHLAGLMVAQKLPDWYNGLGACIPNWYIGHIGAFRPEQRAVYQPTYLTGVIAK
jgi:hypothetical protein